MTVVPPFLKDCFTLTDAFGGLDTPAVEVTILQFVQVPAGGGEVAVHDTGVELTKHCEEVVGVALIGWTTSL
jgi:hypothetical protein